MRIVCTELGEAVLSFDITVPEDIKNMVILDASSPIRLLSKIDKHKIIEAESLPLVQKANITNLADLFDYTNVAWYVYRAGGGYKAFQRDKGNTRIKDAVNLLKSIPKEDAVLFYVFKKRKDDDKKDLPKILRDELTKQGYDLTNGQVCIETFGRETSLNSYSHCRHVIFVGTPWQNMNDLVATALGQHRDINKHLEDDLLRDLDLTEVAYRYHQAAGRGSCRKNGPDGRPQKMAVYCFLQDHQRDALMPYLKTVLPGMQTPAKRPQKKFQKEGKIEAAVAVLLEKLSPKVGICPKQGDCFSITALKRGCCGLSVSANKFTQALEIALKSSPGWSRQGRSLVFKPAM